jgi:hypothetical protein
VGLLRRVMCARVELWQEIRRTPSRLRWAEVGGLFGGRRPLLSGVPDPGRCLRSFTDCAVGRSKDGWS